MYAFDSNASIIVDPGTYHTRIGLSSEPVAALWYPSVYGSSSSNNRFLCGSPFPDDPNLSHFDSFVKDGIVTDSSALTDVIGNALTSLAPPVVPSGPAPPSFIPPVLVAAPPHASYAQITDLVEALFAGPSTPPSSHPDRATARALAAAAAINFPAVYIAASPSLAAFSVGRTAATVIDIGYSGATVSAVVDGMTLRNTCVRSTEMGTGTLHGAMLGMAATTAGHSDDLAKHIANALLEPDAAGFCTSGAAGGGRDIDGGGGATGGSVCDAKVAVALASIFTKEGAEAVVGVSLGRACATRNGAGGVGGIGRIVGRGVGGGSDDGPVKRERGGGGKDGNAGDAAATNDGDDGDDEADLPPVARAVLARQLRAWASACEGAAGVGESTAGLEQWVAAKVAEVAAAVAARKEAESAGGKGAGSEGAGGEVRMGGGTPTGAGASVGALSPFVFSPSKGGSDAAITASATSHLPDGTTVNFAGGGGGAVGGDAAVQALCEEWLFGTAGELARAAGAQSTLPLPPQKGGGADAPTADTAMRDCGSDDPSATSHATAFAQGAIGMERTLAGVLRYASLRAAVEKVRETSTSSRAPPSASSASIGAALRSPMDVARLYTFLPTSFARPRPICSTTSAFSGHASAATQAASKLPSLSSAAPSTPTTLPVMVDTCIANAPTSSRAALLNSVVGVGGGFGVKGLSKRLPLELAARCTDVRGVACVGFVCVWVCGCMCLGVCVF